MPATDGAGTIAAVAGSSSPMRYEPYASDDRSVVKRSVVNAIAVPSGDQAG